MIPILDSKRQYAQIGAEVEKAVCEVLRSGSYILGANCKALESELAKYIGCNYTVTLNSGTDALHLALRALDIGAGDEVITTELGYHVVLRTETKEKAALEDVKEDITETLASEYLAENSVAAVKALQEIRKDYELEIVDSELKSQYAAYMQNLLNYAIEQDNKADTATEQK